MPDQIERALRRLEAQLPSRVSLRGEDGYAAAIAIWAKPVGPMPRAAGDLEEISLLAGESVGQTKRLMSAASIIDEMIRGAEAVIRKRLESMVVE